MGSVLKSLEKNFVNFLIVMVSYLATFSIVATIVTPLQTQYVSNSELVSLLFLPHGVRVLTCVIYGPRLGAIYLLFTSLIASILLGTIDNHATITQSLLIIVGALSVPAAFVFLEFIHEDTRIGLTRVKHNTLKTIVHLALISSLINSLGQSLVIDGLSHFEVQPRIIFKFLIGDLLGSLAVFIFLRFVLNRLKLS